MPTKNDQASSWARDSVADVGKNIGYEVLPFKGTEEKVLAHVPKDIRLTVTASPPKGIDATIDLTTRLAGHGYAVAPHLSARMISDTTKLREIVGRLQDAGIRSLFVIGGDSTEPGEFADALSLLKALNEIGHDFDEIGIGGYPEGHALIPDQPLNAALKAKAPLATYIATQICFNAKATISWAHGIRASGVDLPIRVGMPGAVSRQKLVRISAGIGLGQSAKFLRKQQNMLWRFFLPGGYSPDKLIDGLIPSVSSDENRISGFHIFTFNELEKTEEWRKQLIRRLSSRR